MPAGTPVTLRLRFAIERWTRAHPKRKRYLRGILAGLVSAVVMAICYRADVFDEFEQYTLDLRFRRLALPDSGDDSLVLIQVDEESLDHIRATGQAWPPRRPLWGQIVQYAREGGAEAVVLDITFAEPSPFTVVQTEFGLAGETDDQVFASQLKSAGGAYLACTTVDGGSPLAGEARPVPALPFRIELASDIPELTRFAGLRTPIAPIGDAPQGLGSAFVRPDADGVVRRYEPVVMVAGKPYPSLATLLAGVLLGTNEINVTGRRVILGDRMVRLDPKGRMVLNYRGPWTKGNVRNPNGRPYPYVNLKMVMESVVADACNRDAEPGAAPAPVPFPKSAFRGKVVFIGYSAGDLGDVFMLPTSGQVQPGVLIHMTALDNMLHGDPLHLNDPSLLILLGVIGAAVLAAFLVSFFTSWQGPVVLAAMLGATGLAARAAFYQDIWMEFGYVSASILLGFVTSGSWNYAAEYREKRKIRGYFAQYVAPEVVDELLKDPEKLRLGGQNREMTIFFSDLAGFTSISEGMGPEALVKVMNEYLGGVTDVIRQQRGTVDKYIGDAVMAFWNAPLDQPDHALRACLAAIDSQKFLETLRRRYPVLSMRVGLNTGLVTVGNMGTEEKKNYTVMGDPVNLASRLEGANKNYHTGTMIGEDTFRQVAGKVVTRELDLLRVKGKGQPVRVYELLGRPGEVDAKRTRILASYEKGLECYRRRCWSEAIRHFQSAADLDPQDGPAQLYLERCHLYLVNPPEPDWDGVTTLTTK